MKLQKPKTRQIKKLISTKHAKYFDKPIHNVKEFSRNRKQFTENCFTLYGKNICAASNKAGI